MNAPNLEVKGAIHTILLSSEDGRQMLSHGAFLRSAAGQLHVNVTRVSIFPLCQSRAINVTEFLDFAIALRWFRKFYDFNFRASLLSESPQRRQVQLDRKGSW